MAAQYVAMGHIRTHATQHEALFDHLVGAGEQSERHVQTDRLRGSLFIEDPANSTGNDLSQALTDAIRSKLSKIARNTLDAVVEHGWEHVLGDVDARNAVARVQILRSAAGAVAVPTRPWASAD